MMRLTRTRVVAVGERRLDRRPGRVYLPNHRSFAGALCRAGPGRQAGLGRACGLGAP